MKLLATSQIQNDYSIVFCFTLASNAFSATRHDVRIGFVSADRADCFHCRWSGIWQLSYGEKRAAENGACGAVSAVSECVEQTAAKAGPIYFGQNPEVNGLHTILHPEDSSNYNAMRVRASRITAQKGEVPFLFCRISGTESKPLIADVTAAFFGRH